MTDKKSTRRDLLKPVQLLTIAFVCALFAGIVTAVATGAFQGAKGAEIMLHAWVLAGIFAGITFIVVLLSLSLLLLVVDPAQVAQKVDSPVLVDKEEEDGQNPPSDARGDEPRA